jgi:hypothetical protein
MKTMLWKELRENLLWALLALAGIGCVEAYGLVGHFRGDGPVPLMKSAFLMASTWGSAAFGVLLGLIQILPEQKRDRWAALLHRPVSRDVIFFGKAISGVLLYLLATVPPLLASIWYSSRPGNLQGPFSTGFILPGLVDLLAGIGYYFAGLFAGLRRGWWCGPRISGFAVALIMTNLISSEAVSIQFALALIAVEIVVFLGAAFGAMRTNGSFSKQPCWSRVCVMTITATACLVALLFALEFCSFLNSFLPEPPAVGKAPAKNPYVYRDAAGKELVRPSAGQQKRGGEIAAMGLKLFGYRSVEDHRFEIFALGGEESPDIQKQAGGIERHEHWYYVKNQRLILGYDEAGLIGSIGEDGFHPGREKAVPFKDELVPGSADRPWKPSCFRMGQRVCVFEPKQRKMETFYTVEEGGLLEVEPFAALKDNQWDSFDQFLAVLKDRVLVLDLQGKLLVTLPRLHAADFGYNINRQTISATADRYFFYCTRESNWSPGPGINAYLELFDAQGKHLNTYTLSGPGYYSEPLREFMKAMMSPAMGGVTKAYRMVCARLDSEQEPLARFISRIFRADSGAWQLAFACAAVVLAWARLRKFSWSRSVGWAVFSLGFNLAGLIAFRLLEDWPRRIKCPGCSKRREIAETTCPHCQSPWPAPKRDGTEIVEENTQALAAF